MKNAMFAVLVTMMLGGCGSAELKKTRNALDEAQAQLEECQGKLEASEAERQALLDEQAKLSKQRKETLKKLQSELAELIASGKIQLKIKNNRIIIVLPTAVLFSPGSNVLSEDGKAALKEVAEVLATIKDRSFQIAGHTDSTPKKAMKFADNWELSAARATEVLKYLVSQGLSASVLSATGYGEFQPEGDNSTDEGKAMNRRIEITLVPKISELPDLSELQAMID